MGSEKKLSALDSEAKANAIEEGRRLAQQGVTIEEKYSTVGTASGSTGSTDGEAREITAEIPPPKYDPQLPKVRTQPSQKAKGRSL